MAQDPYATLGVSKSASADEIKRAYRNMSKEWHPDKHKGDKAAEDKFKEINQAYEVLSDPQKKQQYDTFGSMGGDPRHGSGPSGFDFSGFTQGNMGGFGDMFDAFFGGGGASRPGSRSTRGADREAEVAVDLKDVIRDIDINLHLRRMKTCGTCSGKGAEPGTDIVTCTTCSGTGQVTRTVQSFFGTMQQRSMCNTCSGSGKVPKTPCKTCSGEGRVSSSEDVRVRIPAGIEDGQSLRLEGYGDAGRQGQSAGDLYVHVHVRRDARFERDGHDITSTVNVDLLTALLGGTLSVETLHGNIDIEVSAGTQPNQTLRIKGKGVPVLNSSRMGDHYVTLNIEIPKKLSRSERKILEQWKEARND